MWRYVSDLVQQKTLLGIEAVNQIWGGVPTWYLWLSDAMDAYQLQLVDAGIDENSPATKQGFFSIKKPDAIICCGISEIFDKMLKSAGIKLISGIAGDVEQVAEAFLSNRIDEPCFRMPGYKEEG